MFAEATTPSPPMLTALPENMIVPFLGQASFSCVASGYPQPEIQWFKDGLPINGATSSALVIGEVLLSDRGFYHCTATNSEGSATSPQAVLNLRGIYQFTVPVMVPVSASGPFPVGEIPSSEVLLNIFSIVGDLNDAIAGSDVGTDPMFVVYSMDTVGNVTTVSSTK